MPGLKNKDRMQLTKVLKSMPANIRHLREGILAIARQDEGLLGNGEADLRVLFRDLRKNAGANGQVDGNALAKEMKEWMDEAVTKDDSWAGPLWFVQGYLQAMGKQDTRELVEPARPPANGLELTTIEIPAGMGVKLWSRGVELTNREVRIFVIEVERDRMDGWLESAKRVASPEWSATWGSGITELDTNFQIGALHGARSITHHDEAQLEMMRMYMVSVDEACLEIAIFSKKSKGGVLKPYETVLGTIRAK